MKTLTNSPIKYPKTLHLPWSEGVNDDDKVQNDLSFLVGKQVVVLEKMDGENATHYTDYYHARSMSSDSNSHWTRNHMGELQKKLSKDIPDGWRICGENMLAAHSIKYENLPSYFLVFSIWNQNNECLSWDDTKEFCYLTDLDTVPELYRGEFNQDFLKQLEFDKSKVEGYVVRPVESFKFEDFSKAVLKYVRKNHVQTGTAHWMYSNVKIEKNGLKTK